MNIVGKQISKTVSLLEQVLRWYLGTLIFAKKKKIKEKQIPHKIIKAADKNMVSCQSPDGSDNE